MRAHKLKYNEIKPLREELLSTQKGRCALCGGKVLDTQAALDHDHKSGHIRGVLHFDCNVLLGKIENFVQRKGKGIVTRGGLSNLLKSTYNYMQIDYSRNPLHCTHFTPEEKLLRKYKRLYKKSKRQSTKDKYQILIQETQKKL